MKHFFAALFISIFSIAAAAQTSKWKITQITLPETISDILIEDLNNDGRKDMLLIAGNFVNIFYNKKEGISETPDDRFFYRQLGEFIDVGEVDPSWPGLELLGISEDGVKCFRRVGSHYVESPGFLISANVDMPKYRLGPAFSDFAFDINADGKDEIFILRNGKAFFYHLDDSGNWVPEEIEDLAETITVSVSDNRRANADLLLRPSILTKSSVLVQDMDGDGMMDLVSSNLRRQEQGFRFLSTDFLPGVKKATSADRHRFFLDINGDGKLDMIFLEAKDAYAEKMNLFPVAKIFIHMRKKNGFSPTPDYVFKTIIVNNQAMFVDVNGDGALDFISVWPEITPGSKENIIQLLLESTLVFSFRCYLHDAVTGYSNAPEINIKAKIKGDLSYLSRKLPFDIIADLDGDGTNDLMIFRDQESVLLYYLDFSVKKKIRSVSLIKIPGGFLDYRVSDLDGNGRSEIIFIKDKEVQIFAYVDD